jgi:hypothetical protein
MTDDKVVSIHGGKVEPKGEPRAALISVLENALERAKNGELQSFIGTGWTEGGFRFTVWCDHHSDVYQMLGSIAWLHSEYIHRHVSDQEDIVDKDEYD